MVGHRLARKQTKGAMDGLRHKMPFELRAHHARPVRRRHAVSLGVLSMVFVLGFVAWQQQIYDWYNKQLGASLSMHEHANAATPAMSQVVIRSSLGYSVTTNADYMEVTAKVEGGDRATSYGMRNVSALRPYNELVFSRRPVDGSGVDAYDRVKLVLRVGALGTGTEGPRAVADQNRPSALPGQTLSLASEKEEVIGGVTFLKQIYEHGFPYTARGAMSLEPTRTYVYSAVLPSGRTVNMKLEGVTAASSLGLYQQIIGTFSLQTESAVPAQVLQAARLNKPSGLTIAERMGMGSMVRAERPKIMDSARITATHASAVAKVYHVTCGKIVYRTQVLSEDTCTGTTGTGFFVSGDGYLVTNGHVVVTSAKDTVASTMTSEVLARMLQIDGYSAREMAQLAGQFSGNTQIRASVIRAVQRLPTDALAYEQRKEFYIVALSNEVPILEQIMQDRSFKETATIKRAQLVATDYDATDMYNSQGFTRSDVAVLKVPGSHYPTVRLGSLDTVVQGAGVTVVGFPADAEANGLVKNNSLQSTVTQGIVGAIREVNGGDHRVVQSDVSIGHGNSGGPAFGQDGKVFGVATYVLGADTEQGTGGLSYLRDVKDVRALLAAQSIRPGPSDTQTIWEEGLDDFYGAHYTEAIKKFQKVQLLYGQHVLAAQYIALAQEHIASGDESDNALVPLMLAAITVLGAGGLVVVGGLMMRHRAHHHMYRALQAGYVTGPFEHLLHRPALVPVPVRHKPDRDA